MNKKYNTYELDTEGVLNTLENIPFKSSFELIAEMSGSMTHNSNLLSYNIIDNKFILFGLDGGITDNDMENLQMLYRTSNKGLSKHGIGARAASTNMTNQAGESIFRIFGYNKNYNGIEFSVKEKGTLKLSKAESKDLFTKYFNIINRNFNNEINIEEGGTIWEIPASYNIINGFNSEIKNGIKKMFNYKLFIKEIEINFFMDDKNELLEVVNPLFFNEDSKESLYFKDCKLLKAKILDEVGKESGSQINIFKIGEEYWQKNKGKTKNYNKIDKNDFIIKKIASEEFEIFCYCPENHVLLNKEFKVNKTELNGFYFTLNNILISHEGMKKCGYRGTGDSETGIIVFNQKRIEDITKTSLNKSNSIVPQPFIEHFMQISALKLRKFRRCVYPSVIIPKIDQLTESKKKDIAGRQNNKCANNLIDEYGKKILNYECPFWKNGNNGNFDLSGYEIDHIIRFADSQDNNESNLQALCRCCHSVKTKKENRKENVY